MTREYEYDDTADKTTLYWNDEQQGTIAGEITEWRNGYPLGEARTVIADAIQNAGTPDRIRMQYDLVYGFKKRDTQS